MIRRVIGILTTQMSARMLAVISRIIPKLANLDLPAWCLSLTSRRALGRLLREHPALDIPIAGHSGIHLGPKHVISTREARKTLNP